MNDYLAGATSVVETIFLQDATSTTGAGKTGLAYNTSSLTCYYKRSNGTASVAVTLADITTLGTFVSGGFKAIDGTNMPGLYEFHPPDAAFAAGAKEVTFYFQGATNLAPRPIKFRLKAVNPDDAVRFGLSALPNAAANAANGLPTFGTGSGQINPSSGKVPVVQLVAGDFAASSLNGKGDWSTAGQVSSLAVNTRANLNVPVEIETPDSSTQVYKVRLHLFDVEGNMEAPDSTPTVALTNAAGTDRSGRLSAASNPSTGVYTWDYTATAGDAEEQLVWVFTVVEGGLTRTYPATTYVVEESAYRFSSTDRSNLGAIKTKTDQFVFTNANRVDATTTAMANNVLTAAALATDAGAEIAAAVWDLPTSGHTTSATFGAAMNAAGSAGDPWATVLPASYGAGTAGFILPAIKTKTDSLTFTTANKVDAKLASDGLDNIAATAPTAVATTFVGKMLAVWERLFGKVVKDDGAGTITLMQGAGSTAQATQTFTSTGGVDTVNRAT
jgi:hypothetical protein